METTTHMLGVPPNSRGGATNLCVMSRLTKCLAPAPFSARSARLTSAPHQHVDHDPATPRVNDQSSSCRGPARFPSLAVAPAFIGSALYGAGRYPSSAGSMRPSLFGFAWGALDGESSQSSNVRTGTLRLIAAEGADRRGVAVPGTASV